jgi:hypothetical protein
MMKGDRTMIVRTVKNKENPYYVKARTAVVDKRLSWKAKGIHDYLMSKPDHWQANIEELAKASSDGIDAVRSGVNELIKYGYMKRMREVDDKGKVTGWRLDTYEQPHLAQPDMGFPDVAEPDVENPTLVINESKKVMNVVSNEIEADACNGSASPTPSPSPRKTKKVASPESTALMEAYIELIKANEPGAVINYQREREGINRLAAAGCTPDKLAAAYRTLKADRFWQAKHISSQSLGTQIGAILARVEDNQTTMELAYEW